VENLDENYRILDVNNLLSRRVHEIDFSDIEEHWNKEFNKDSLEDPSDKNHSIVINNITPRQFEYIISGLGETIYNLKSELLHLEMDEDTPEGKLKRVLYEAFSESTNADIQGKFLHSDIPKLVEDIYKDISKNLKFELKENK
jgi:hypothetical protein